MTRQEIQAEIREMTAEMIGLQAQAARVQDCIYALEAQLDQIDTPMFDEVYGG